MLQWLPLIGTAISAVGSLFAPKPKATTTKSSIDLIKLRTDAEAAGFNPLTIIRGGGLAGYGVSTTSAPADYRVSNAFSIVGQGLANFSFDPYADKRRELEFALAEAQLRNYAMQEKRMTFGSPASSSAGSVTATGENVTNYTLGGVPIFADTGWSDAEVIEARHGDLAGSIYGFFTTTADTVKNVVMGTKGWYPDVMSQLAGVFGVKAKPEVLEIMVRGGGK